MRKCDLCGKELTWNHSIRIDWVGMLLQYRFCDDCGAPLVAFLRGSQLIPEGKKLIRF